ncbi:5-oxoprolinase subunit PxpA [Cohnella sp. CFH 77786]|uniref:LamB/YcsF family protein n=1 Tax=Cohnella sp. CFH 77786 TaxID=2662265 RepID=UPI001C609C10|nr:5-oxoprolinase subunit PxpA [Cohnella sp. CFH 77786]MBW5446976.1 5-oxoprolinase subunit PxpA [Cohnella sp. CFH 77786]
MANREIEIDLNADVGEGFGPYAFGEDEALLRTVSSANIACGFHAGDPHIMRRTVEMCLERGVAIGAHPGLPDRLGFGRREMRATAEDAADWILYQVGALQAFAVAAGGAVRHVKPHGALYHMSSGDAELAEAVVRAIRSLGGELLLFGPPNSRLQEAAERHGLGFAAEGFADRAYAPDGCLAPRGAPGALIEDPEQALSQALALVRGGSVPTIGGSRAELTVHTICIHGDTPEAAVRAARLAEGLRAAGIAIRPPNRTGM